jgi:succinoglycan biosynthesis protein ExoL
MKDIVFIISYLPLGRILRRLKTASSVGNVAIIYWNRMLKNKIVNKIPQTIEQVEVVQKAAEGNPLKTFAAMIVFTIKALQNLIRLRPRVIHVELLNMLLIAVFYKFIFSRKVRVIYEVSDLHGLLIDQQVGIKEVISKFLFHLEKLLCGYVDLLIVTSEYFVDEYYCKFFSKEKVLFIPNSPEEKLFKGFNKKNDGKFTVGFIGYVRYKNQLEMLIRVSQRCDINVLVAGDGTDYPYLSEKYKDCKNVIFYGPYEYEKEIKHLYEMVDCVYSVYDTSLKNVRIALPNKLYEAIVCNLPIIVAEDTKLAKLVQEWGVGVEVSDIIEDDLSAAITRLKNDNGYYNNIINNCRKLANRYNYLAINEQYLNLIKDCLSGHF